MIQLDLNQEFWENGNGRDFIKWSGISDISASSYDTELFYQYDKEVDKLVKQWMKDDDFSPIMKSLHSGDVSSLPDNYLELKKETEEIPDWVDERLVQMGSELSQRSGLTGLLVLRDFALLGGYNFANLTKPLVGTGALEKGAVYRLYNTLNFWVDVSRTSPDSYDKRIQACIRTRLVHCASRLLIQKNNPNWDAERYGIPINYADMIATHIAFTVYYLYGLDQLNFSYTEEEERGIFHLWKYVTYMLGVPHEIIPNDKIEALHFFRFWTRYQNAPDQDSLKLTTALLNENTPISLFKLDIIKRNMGYIHKSISNYLLDDFTKSNLDIPSVRFKRVIPHALKVKNEIPIDRKQQIENGDREQSSVLADYRQHIKKRP